MVTLGSVFRLRISVDPSIPGNSRDDAGPATSQHIAIRFDKVVAGMVVKEGEYRAGIRTAYWHW